VTAAETAIGAAGSQEIRVSSSDVLGVFLNYTKGDETNVAIIPKFLYANGGDEFPIGTWLETAGAKTFTADSFVMSATGKHYLPLNVSGVPIVKLYMDATGGTPTGTLGVAYTVDDA
jgi:hypothetical protein